MILELLLLFVAGFFGGILNSIAGGGTFITFPALLFVGVPPISANATNTFASCSGYLSGTYAFRKDLQEHKHELPKFIVVSLIGGILGAWLLLQTPEAVFQEIIPWLLLFATVLFTFGTRLNEGLRKLTSRHKHATKVGAVLALVLLMGVCVYGGFFNAGLGIISLSYLAVAGYTNINAMNGLKLLISSCVSLIAIVLFAYNDTIAWIPGMAVLVGSLVGGYMAALISRQLPQIYVRGFVVLVSISITTYFFCDFYAI
ncbi:MAG: sulfite exporter TauE/SafE family protein [Magnetovibrio sp.]|nr:sulfite exporter TauE/SafE family protein [Magnetovibrio sp.]